MMIQTVWATATSLWLAIPAQQLIDVMQRQCRVHMYAQHIGYDWAMAPSKVERSKGSVRVNLSAPWLFMKTVQEKKARRPLKEGTCEFRLNNQGDWTLKW